MGCCGDARRSPWGQLLTLGLIAFCCPGIFNALIGMAGGIDDPDVSNLANSLLYACLAAGSLVAPVWCNRIGPRATLSLGTFGYAMYPTMLFCYSREIVSSDIVVIAACINGLGAAFVWTAQGQLCLAYPTKGVKGKYFSYFWLLYNSGGVGGGIVGFLSNYHSDTATEASMAYFIIILSLMLCGLLLSFTLYAPEDVLRTDGTMVVNVPLGSLWEEIKTMASLLTRKRILLLIPMFMYSSWVYSYQYGVYNAGMFNSRTQGWNTAWFWFAEMIGAYAMGRLLDAHTLGTLRERATYSLMIIFCMFNLTWFLALRILTGDKIDKYGEREPALDFKDYAILGPFWTYMAWGLTDILVNSWIYWVLGQFSDDLTQLSRYIGVLKASQGCGAGIAWALGHTPALTQIGVNWGLFLFASGCAWIVATQELRERNDTFDLLTDAENMPLLPKMKKNPSNNRRSRGNLDDGNSERLYFFEQNAWPPMSRARTTEDPYFL
eukprot:m.132607 g.132607  ORF g.132607 m.132607 type:complete len:493 (-) comp14650_c0_seq1:1402-2880(-)